MKKGLSLLLSLLMVISMFSCLTVVASAATSDYELDTSYTVASGTEGVFIAPESAYYTFASDGDGDPRLRLYDTEGNQLASWDDNNDMNFYGSIYLEANQQVTCEFYDYNGEDFNFTITKVVNNVASIQLTLADDEIVEETEGTWNSYWDEATESYVDYYYYYFYTNTYGNTITVTYNDGSVVDYVCNGSTWYADDGSILNKAFFEDLTNQQETPWTLGSNNYVTVSYFGKEASAAVTIVENPVESISFAFDASYYMLKEKNGYWDIDDNGGEFYYYQVPSANQRYGNALTINYTDGRSVEYVYSQYAEHDEEVGDWYSGWVSSDGELLTNTDINTSCSQYDTPWVVDGENLLTVEYMNRECQVSVPVKENPVASISFIPVDPEDYTIIKESSGYWSERYNDETGLNESYFYYYGPEIYETGNILTLHYTDGTSCDYTYGYKYNEYTDSRHSGWYNADGEKIDYSHTWIEWGANQYESPWTLGSNNYITINYMYRECQVPVTIIENPVASISFTPAEPYEYILETNGYWDWTEAVEDDDVSEQFFYYNTRSIYQYGNTLTVNYTDGSSVDYVYTDDVYYDEIDDWYYDGWISSTGEVLNSQTVQYSIDQYSKPWVLGSDNYFTVSYSGREYQVPVTIKENPVVSISFTPEEPYEYIEHMNGYWNDRWDSAAGEYVDYFYYYTDSIYSDGNTLTVNYTDGRTVDYVYDYGWDLPSGESGWYSSSGEFIEKYDVDYNMSQSNSPWVLNGDNYFTVEYSGREYQVPVTIKENPVASISFTPAKPYEYIENTFGEWYWSESWDGGEDPTYYEYFRYDTPSVCIAGNVLTVNYSDGRIVDYVYTNDDVYIEEDDCWYDGGWVSATGETISYYDVDRNSDQYYDHWTLGNDNCFTVEYFGKECQVPVTIVETPVKSIEIYLSEPVTFVEEANGYWDERYNEETDDYEDYFYYSWDLENYIFDTDTVITVNYKDGTKADYTYSKIQNFDEDRWDYYYWAWTSSLGTFDEDCVVVWSNQEADPWLPGEDNFFYVSVMGVETQVPVEIIPYGVTAIEFIPAKPLTVRENSGGYWNDIWSEELDEYVQYYRYSVGGILNQLNNTIRVTFKNGNTVDYVYSTDDGKWVSADGDELYSQYLDYSSNQYDVIWTTETENIITISYIDCDDEVSVTVKPALDSVFDSWFEAEQIDSGFCVITDILVPDEQFNGVVTIPEEINGCKVVAIDDYLLMQIDNLRVVNLPEYFDTISSGTFDNCHTLAEVNVDESNSLFVSVNGVVYNKPLTDIVYCPADFSGDLWISSQVKYLSENTLSAMSKAKTITVDANNPYYKVENGIIYNADFTKIIKAISLPENYTMKETVVEIGSLAFAGIQTVKSAKISSNVTEISYAAFMGCTALQSVDLPENLVKIGIASFDSTGLASVKLPGTTESIGYQAFYNSKLASVSLNDGLRKISEIAFANTPLTKVEIPSTVTVIGPRVFQNCTSLSNVDLGTGVKEIPYYAFNNCTALTEVLIPASVTYISDGAFIGCTNLVNINVDEANSIFASINGLLVDESKQTLVQCAEGRVGEVVIPEGIKSIENEALRNRKNITSISIPASMEELENYLFNGCVNLVNFNVSANNVNYSSNDGFLLTKDGTKLVDCPEGKYGHITIPYGVERMVSGAFRDCEKLTAVTICDTVNELWASTFSYCPNLTAFYVTEANAKYSSQDGMLYNKDKSVLVACPRAIGGAVVVPSTVVRIFDDTFYGCQGITSLTVSDGVQTIGNCAFMDCTAVETVYLPDSVTEISYQAFSGCSSIKSIALPSKINSISWRLFEDCVGLEAIEIPVSVTNIDSYAFDNCVSLKDVYYTGTEEQWNNIEIGEGNEYLTNATIHFNSTMPEIDATPTLKLIGDTWYYMAGNKVLTDYTGLVEYAGNFFYVENGILRWDYTGLAPYGNEWFYVSGGIIDFSYTGLVAYADTFFYVQNGWLNWGYTGLAPYYNDWFYVTNGVIDFSYTGLVAYADTFFYVQNGWLSWGYTGIALYYSDWYYVTNGVIDFSYTGLTLYGNDWYYVENGWLNFNYTGLVAYAGTFFYVQNGWLNWGYTGLAPYGNDWFYVSGGIIDFSYTGYTNYSGYNFYITNGWLDWSKQ